MKSAAQLVYLKMYSIISNSINLIVISFPDVLRGSIWFFLVC